MAGAPISWDNTSWADVQAQISAGDNAVPRSSSSWLANLLSDLNPKNYTWIGQPGFDYDKFWGTPWQGGTWDQVPEATGRVMGEATASAVRGALDVAGGAVQGAFGDSAASAWRTAFPYVALGAAVLLVMEIRKAR